MRAVPSVTFYSPNLSSPSNGEWQELYNGVNLNIQTYAGTTTNSAVGAELTGGSGITNSSLFGFAGNYAASAEL